MIVEHKFVTTLPQVEAMRMASEFLGRKGFSTYNTNAFSLDGAGWTTLQLRRGKPNTRGAALLQLPQRVQLEWDRQRITVAASIADLHSKKRREALLLGIVSGLEALLVRRQDATTAAAAWDQVEADIQRSTRRANIAKWIIASVVVGGLITLAVIVVIFRR